MTLVSLKEILKNAQDGKYAVIAGNLINLEMIKAGINTAERLKSPLILQIAPVQFEAAPLKFIGPMMVSIAKRASVPVCVHLDHGFKLSEIQEAIELGFSSVMIDASAYDFEENIRLTKEVVDCAKKHGVSVEAELGCVGDEGVAVDMEKIKDKLTVPSLAKEFVERTGCDALAVAIGNAHGPYIKTPNLDFQRLEDINSAVDVPLVLHGGSGISKEDFRKSISLGITKVNVATAIHQAVGNGIASINYKDFFKASKVIEKEVSEVIEAHMDNFMSIGKAK